MRRVSLLAVASLLASAAPSMAQVATDTPTATPTATPTSTATVTPSVAPRGAWTARSFNPVLYVQPDEVFGWSCTFPVSLNAVVGTTVTVVSGTDPTPSTLVTDAYVDVNAPTHVLFTLTPSGHPNLTVYQVHLVAWDGVSAHLACDGKVDVRATQY